MTSKQMRAVKSIAEIELPPLAEMFDFDKVLRGQKELLIQRIAGYKQSIKYLQFFSLPNEKPFAKQIRYCREQIKKLQLSVRKINKAERQRNNQGAT